MVRVGEEFLQSLVNIRDEDAPFCSSSIKKVRHSKAKKLSHGSKLKANINDAEKSLSIHEGTQQKLLKKTHLHLQRKKITHIDDIRPCRNLRVLFLQENFLKRIGHLRHLHLLQELYLHDNQISRLEGLNNLRNLKKLHLPRNRVSVVEGLPPYVEELEVASQFVSAGNCLLLDPQAFTQVLSTLEILDISENGLKEIGAVGLLSNLKILHASNNELDDVDHLLNVLSHLNYLEEADFRGNPVASLYRLYRPKIIKYASSKLVLLDGKTVTKENRIFLTNSANARYKRQTKDKNNKGIVFSNPHLLFDEKKSMTLGTTHEAVSYVAEKARFVLGGLKNDEFNVLMSTRFLLNDNPELPTSDAPLNETDNPQLPRIIPKLFLRTKKSTAKIS